VFSALVLAAVVFQEVQRVVRDRIGLVERLALLVARGIGVVLVGALLDGI